MQRRARHGRAHRMIAAIATAIALTLSAGQVSVAADQSSVSAAAAPRIGIPLVLGTAAVGGQVTVEHGMAPLAPHESGGGVQYPRPIAQYSYQWLADGKPIAGATEGSLDIRSALTGKQLSFRVTARMPEGGPVVTATSLRTPRVTKAGILEVVRLPINPTSGNSRFSVTAKGWPSGTTLKSQWVIDELPVKGATGRQFELLPRPHTTMNLGAVVTATRPGYETLLLHLTSGGRAGLFGSTLQNAGAPQIVSAAGAGTPTGQAAGILDGFVASNGGPLVGAKVTVFRTGRGSAYETAVEATSRVTDADGHVRVAGLTPGNYCLKVAPARGYAQEPPDCHSLGTDATARVYAGSESSFVLWTEKIGAIRGTVTDSRGKKVRGARVTAYYAERTGQGFDRLRAVATVTADSGGAYRIPNLPVSSYVLKISGTSSTAHKADWWRSKGSGFEFDSTWVEPGKTMTRNAVLAAYVPVGTPTVSGRARVGSSLTVAHPKTKGVVYSYRWKADGKSISGATSSKLTVRKGQVGARISVQIVATGSGWAKTTRESAKTARVSR